MGLLDSYIQKQNPDTGQGELIDLGLNSKVYYDGSDGVQNNGGNYGNYQFVSLDDVINSFMVAYVGEDKIISKARRTDVAFHAQRALAELSFDTFKSIKAFEIEVPSILTMPLPQDYVHYVKLSWVDDAGIYHTIYPSSKTGNPTSYQQETNGDLRFETNTWKVNIPGAYMVNGAFAQGTSSQEGILSPAGNSLSQTVNHAGDNKVYTDKYIEYGITRSRDSFGNRISSDNDFVSKTPLPQFNNEVRVTIAQNVAGGGQNMIYGANVLQGGNATNDGMIILMDTDPGGLAVGMSVFGPGIPDGTTITSLEGITSVTYPGIALLTTSPQYQEWKLMDSLNQPAINPGKPIVRINAQLYGKEIIFVDLNKESNAWSKYKGLTPTDNQNQYDDGTYDLVQGERYGIDPQHSQVNGSYYIDDNTGLIHFSSNISGKTVVLNYISDSLGTDGEMRVHKFAEEAMYKCIAYGIMSTKANIQEYVIKRFKQDRFAAIRTAKLRLSNLKLEELTQILRGKSKHLKH